MGTGGADRLQELAWDGVVVVGAGPAGSAAAAVLARLGHPTLLLDRARFPRPKACGECLNPGAVEVLKRLGFLHRVLQRSPARLDGWRIRWPEETHRGSDGAVPSEGGGLQGRLPPPGGLALPREELDHALVDAAREAGARVVEGAAAEGVEAGSTAGGDAARPTLRIRDGDGGRHVLRPRYLVAADGLRSTIARKLGLVRRPPRIAKVSVTFRLRASPPQARTLPGRAAGTGPAARIGTGAFQGQLYLSGEGTLGLAPVNDAGSSWNATLVVDPGRWGRRLGQGAPEVLEEWLQEVPHPWDHPPEVVAGPRGSGPFDRPVAPVTRGRVILAGDAAGYYDPLTGQGIYRALRSGELAALALDRGLRRPEEARDAMEAYGRTLAGTFSGGRRVQRCLESALARSPIRRMLLGTLGLWGGRLDPLVAVTGDAAPARSLLRPASVLAFAGRSPPKHAPGS